MGNCNRLEMLWQKVTGNIIGFMIGGINMLEGGIIGLFDDICNLVRVRKADCDLKIAQIKSKMLNADEEDVHVQIEKTEE